MFDNKIKETNSGTNITIKVNYCNIGSSLYDKGIRDNMIIGATKINDFVVLHFSGNHIVVKEETEYSDWSFHLLQEQ